MKNRAKDPDDPLELVIVRDMGHVVDRLRLAVDAHDVRRRADARCVPDRR